MNQLKLVRKWQKQSMAMLNREGAWVRSYSGYVTRSSHDADAIARAGMGKWVNDTFDKLDLKRTFGTSDRQASLDALRQMLAPMRSGDHFDYGKPVDEPGQMLLIKNDPKYHEQWPRALVPYKRIFGIDEPKTLPRLANDGMLSGRGGVTPPLLPEGTPFGLVGSSSLYKRESYPNGVVPPGSV